MHTRHLSIPLHVTGYESDWRNPVMTPLFPDRNFRFWRPATYTGGTLESIHRSISCSRVSAIRTWSTRRGRRLPDFRQSTWPVHRKVKSRKASMESEFVIPADLFGWLHDRPYDSVLKNTYGQHHCPPMIHSKIVATTRYQDPAKGPKWPEGVIFIPLVERFGRMTLHRPSIVSSEIELRLSCTSLTI